MDKTTTFLEYFAAFEETYIDDDWGRLEKYFTEDAVYRIEGTGSFDCAIEGRDAVFAAIKRCLDGFDRRCERRIEHLEAPELEGDTLRAAGLAIYTRGESPELALEIQEIFRFRDGRICDLTDNYRKGVSAEALGWFDRWAPDLELGYVDGATTRATGK